MTGRTHICSSRRARGVTPRARLRLFGGNRSGLAWIAACNRAAHEPGTHGAEDDRRRVPNAKLTDTSYAPDPAKRFIIGHALINPTRAGAGAISVLRAGGAWLPLSGRVELEYQGLVERLAGDGREFLRLRNRLRLSVGLPGQPPLRAFVSAEGFSVRESALGAYRYQAGATVSGRHARIELYLLRNRVRGRPGFTALGVSAIWTVGRRR